MKKWYAGFRHLEDGGAEPYVVVMCLVDGKWQAEFLDPQPSQKIVNHSPDGFEWGYNGSGPAQLALALVLDVTGQPGVAAFVYQDFKDDFVARWGREVDDRWSMTEEEIRSWVECRMQGAYVCMECGKVYLDECQAVDCALADKAVQKSEEVGPNE